MLPIGPLNGSDRLDFHHPDSKLLFANQFEHGPETEGVESIDKVVVLPAPLGPSRPKVSPSRISREMPRTASKLPKLRARSTTSTLSASTVLTGFGVAAMLTVLSGVAPAWNAKRLNIVDALARRA